MTLQNSVGVLICKNDSVGEQLDQDWSIIYADSRSDFAARIGISN